METIGDLIPIIGPNFAGESGICNDDAAVMEAINLGEMLLWNKSDFSDTTGWYKFCCIDGCITLPSEIKQVRLAWLCGTPMSIGDQWYESIPQIGRIERRGAGCWNKFIQEGNNFATFQEYTLGAYNVRFIAENPADAGVEITAHVIDRYGTKKQDTVTLGLAPAPVDGTTMCKAVTGIVKPRTEGRVRMYAYDPLRNYTLLLAVYQPYDLNPLFIRYKNMACNAPLTIFAKKKFIPAYRLTDFVHFNTQAIIHAIQANVFLKNRDNNNYLACLGLAVQEINRESADLEIPTASPLRMFSPERVTALTPIVGWDEDGWGGYGYGSNLW